MVFLLKLMDNYPNCVSKKIKNNYIYCIIPVRVLFKEVPKNCLEMIVCLIIISILFRLLIIKYIRVYVIDRYKSN
mgnify:CR=1 FL=1